MEVSVIGRSIVYGTPEECNWYVPFSIQALYLVT